MSRAPVVRLDSARRAAELMQWTESDEGIEALREAFSTTTNFGKLVSVRTRLAGRTAFLRFSCSTGDAMGMNMISKGVLKCMDTIRDAFPDLEVLSISGNVCTDKKHSSVNWIEGRGKSVVCETTLTAEAVKNVLKVDCVKTLVDINVSKNLIGSAIAGSIGGFNAHASNIVTAVFLATGQDPAQNVEGSNCMTLMEEAPEGGLRVSVTMPSIEVGTIGGGTTLDAQSAALDLLGVKGANADKPGANAVQLARIVCGTVLAGEISLMSALASNHLVSAHMDLNRK